MSEMCEPIVVIEKREMAELPCDVCGKPVSVMLPYKGDVLCLDCILRGRAYVLREE